VLVILITQIVAIALVSRFDSSLNSAEKSGFDQDRYTIVTAITLTALRSPYSTLCRYTCNHTHCTTLTILYAIQVHLRRSTCH
jgi:hypothetical protein